jgi:hypothetical protein
MDKANEEGSCYMDEDELEDRMPGRVVCFEEELREMAEMDWFFSPD